MNSLRLAVPRINARAELRLALLAAAESCWIYAVILTFGAFAGLPRLISPLGIFIVYMSGLLVGRLLPRSQHAWRVLQLLTIFIAALAILAAVRVELYSDAPLTDLTWLPTYFARVTAFFQRVSAEAISTAALIFAFVRSLGMAQRPLTLWVVGFQFRLGVVFFFATAFFAALTTGVNFIPWIFVFFAVSLLGIALARIEEAGQERPLGPKWAGIMAAMIGLTMLLGYAAAQFLTLEAVNAFFAFLSPLTIVIEILATIIAIPLLYLLEFLFALLAPAFALLFRAMSEFFPNLDLANSAAQRVMSQITQQIANLLPYFRLLGVILVAIFVGWLIGRALKRRMTWEESEMFARESASDHEALELGQRMRPRAPRAPRRALYAENVRRIYAALLAHAETLNLPRREAETPLEFLPRLTARFPNCSAELADITRAYVAVHYAQRPAADAQVRALRALWQKTKAQMTTDHRRQTTDRK